MQYFDSALENQTFAEIASRLLAQVAATERELLAVSDRTSMQPVAPGKWSRKEILGHLIDSAANNHQRFVRSQEADSLSLPGYAQEHWVNVQRYHDRPWGELITLWSAYNRHLAHVLARIPEARRTTVCHIGSNNPVTLSYLALDYVGHVQHHLRQIFGGQWRAV